MDKLVKDGESWNENNGCIHCTCVDGEQKCIITECRTPNCDNPVTHIGQCCATCLDEPDDQHKHVLLTSDNSMTTEPSIAVSNAIQENVESTTKSSNVDYSGTDSVGSNVSPQITSEASNSKQWKVESTTTTFNYVRKTDTASTIPNETSESTISKEIGSTPLDSSTTTTTENSQISSIVSISIEKNVESTNNASNINIIFDIVRTKNASDASTPLPESTASATTINREIGSSSTNSMGTENSSTSPTPIQESTTSASKINGEIGTASTTVMDRTRPASTATPENEEITTKTSRISAESVESSSTPKVANALTTDNINNRTHNYGKEIIESSSPASNIGRDISMKTTEHPDRRTEAPELQTPESTSQHKDRNINESDFRIATSGTNPPFQINEFSGIWLYAGIAVACIVFVLCILLFWLCCCKNRPKIYSSVPNSEFNLNKPITTELVSTTKI
ncbi:putative GPI-anchored protein pfl2 [Scaptodrosophila lebanonensis]|uniref:GPI-anchored protein pfl2 n=1 Tax=Drosophila lebanonensis TaxID=7225 RepID=A0A6J2TVC1_DROLE|nr:putative GPI-anchored protein pfl2 [Scaptodrosophila lebanonensis]